MTDLLARLATARARLQPPPADVIGALAECDTLWAEIVDLHLVAHPEANRAALLRHELRAVCGLLGVDSDSTPQVGC